MEKTNAMRILDRAKAAYTVHSYEGTGALSGKEVAAALGQAALQAYFRPDDANIPHLAKSFSQAGAGSAPQWSQLIRNLKVGQFLLSNGPRNHLVVTVPQRRGR